MSSRVLITGSSGLAGHYLINLLRNQRYECFNLGCDLLDADAVRSRVVAVRPNFCVHLGAITSTQNNESNELWAVNLGGTVNLLRALNQQCGSLKHVVVFSSAAVYSKSTDKALTESAAIAPQNEYAMSKLACEKVAESFQDSMPITIVRPFNFTGPGHSRVFVIPKIISAFAERQEVLELGALDVVREFNDVRDVAKIIYEIMKATPTNHKVNLSSGRGVSLRKVLEIVNQLSEYTPKIAVNPDFIRANDPKSLVGDPAYLYAYTGCQFEYSIYDTLDFMWRSKNTN